MFTIYGPRDSGRMCDGVSRRDFLRVGALGLGGLTLADLLRLKALGAVRPESAAKSVIMVYLPGGPSHIDMYDLKPNAPAEYRGEFKPIRTNVPGVDVCELMPRHAEIADKFAVLRGLKTQGNHDPTELLTGIPAAASGHIGPVRRPAFGCVVSKLHGADGPIPPYVSVSDHRLLSAYDDPEEPAYLGAAHRPFSVQGQVMKDMTLTPEVTRDRLEDRKSLVHSFDATRRDLDNAQQTLAGMDSYQARALEMIASTQVRDALDLSREPEAVREKYGAASTFSAPGDWSKRACQWCRWPRASRFASPASTTPAAGIRTAQTLSCCGPSCRYTIRPCTPYSPIWLAAGWTKTWPWLFGTSSDGRRRLATRRQTAAATGSRRAAPYWRAAVCGWDRS
jgi:Protein of unknown function (DUF1501)